MYECCRDCVAPKRHIGCHSNCKEYLDDKAKAAEIQKKKDAERNTNSYIIGKCEEAKAKSAKKYKGRRSYSKWG